MQKIRCSGFTLSEILIALGILAIIATFTIPKIIIVQQNSQKTAAAKEAASMIAAAFQQLQLDTTVNSTTNAADLTPYMNYISVATSGSVDLHPNSGTGGSWPCTSAGPCLFLHNGGKLLCQNNSFGGTASTNYLLFLYDPDTVLANTDVDGPSKSVQFVLYFNGKITSRGSLFSSYEPSWFTWRN